MRSGCPHRRNFGKDENPADEKSAHAQLSNSSSGVCHGVPFKLSRVSIPTPP
jgi:hypothetical protein